MKKFKLTFAYNGEAESWEQIRNDAENNKISKVFIGTKEFVNVVRCKECKWWDKVDNIDGVDYGTCERPCTAIRQDAFLNENWFCADGEELDA